MTIDNNVTAVVIVALAIYAHAWHGRMLGRPRVLSAIGWVVNILTGIVLFLCWVRLH
jgi:hypothetical protein